MNKVRQTVGVIRYSCGFLFLAFCFCYLLFVQGDVLAWVQHVLSGGLTSYHPLVGALIISVMLFLLQHIISRIIYFTNKFFALSYVPSFLLLAMLTNINENLEGKFIWGFWQWLVPAVLVAFVVAVYIARESENSEDATMQDISSLLWPNYLIMLILVMACGSTPTLKDVAKYELKVERLVANGDYKAAAGVAPNALVSTKRLTQLRMYALSKQGLLADSMFSYPQMYGTKGLIDIHDTVTSNRFPMRNIEFHLGAFSGRTIETSKRFLELLNSDSLLVNNNSQQYQLCYHLLDRDLEEFNIAFRSIYGDTIEVEVPRAYQEAIVMQHPEFKVDSLPIYINKVYVERYAAFAELQSDMTMKVLQRNNRLRREFGNSYWYYYFLEKPMVNFRK